MLLPALSTSIANLGLPALAQAFDASFQHVQWVVLAYLLAITTLIVGAGRLGDMFGRRRLSLSGIAIFTIASIFCGLASSLLLLIIARAAQGIGAALMMALTVAMVGETVPKAKTGSAMGLLGTMSAVGTALGPSLGGVLISGFGWRAIFFIAVPLGMLTFLLVSRSLPSDRPNSNPVRVDVPGIVLLALALGAYALAMTIGRGSMGMLNIALMATALVFVGLLLIAERRAASPMIQPAMFRNPMLSAGLGMSALVSTVIMATLVVGPFYLSGALELDAALVGLVLSSGPVVAALTGVPAGRMVDRFGAGRMTMTGLTAMAVGSFALSAVPSTLGIAGYVGPIAIITAGYAIFQTANNTTVMGNVSPDLRGLTSGMLHLSRNLGLITGTSALGVVFALASGASDITTAHPVAVATGMQTTFAVGTVLILVALIIAIVGRILAGSRHGRSTAT